jgi:RNA polymerase-binding transcription factor
MDPITLDTYRQRLLAQQQQMVKRIFALEEDLQVTPMRERAFDDRAEAEESEEVLERLDTQSRRETEEIQAALARIEAGTYGRCEVCHNPISAARFDALPMARRCVRCQKQAESMAKE